MLTGPAGCKKVGIDKADASTVKLVVLYEGDDVTIRLQLCHRQHPEIIEERAPGQISHRDLADHEGMNNYPALLQSEDKVVILLAKMIDPD